MATSRYKGRKYRVDLQAKAKVDRIGKAVELINSGAVMEWTDGRYLVKTERMNVPYTVTVTSCGCPDFILHKHPCKHIWAAIGSTAALLIHAIRQSASVTELEQTARDFKDELGGLPDAFLKIARLEYGERLYHLRAAEECEKTAKMEPSEEQLEEFAPATGEEMILTRPEPKSLGRVNGFEI